jgi:hypothetical protein
MLGAQYFVWRENKEWYEIVHDEKDEDIVEYRLTDKAPPEAVESFELWQKKRQYAREHGIVY